MVFELMITLHGKAELMDTVKLMAEKDSGCIVIINDD